MRSPLRKREGDAPDAPDAPTAVRREPPRERKARIRCPRCAWRPRASSRWLCHCGGVWNTFATAGLCPRCGHQWEDTACLSCLRWSKHRDWYAPQDEP
jgi:hypothetical protein